jgi:chromate reductase, NAD(P)H dehydrogenase (quinone)
MMQPRILVFAGSNRKNAYSGKLATVAALALAKAGADVTHVQLSDYALPIIDEDFEREHGIPDAAMRLGRLMASHDGVMICSPEYNGSIPPLLKNTIDWLSRISKDGLRPLKPFEGRVAALCSSSPGAFAGVRGLLHLRAVAVQVGMTVISEQCSIAQAHEAFGEDGALQNPRSAAALDKVAQALVMMCRAVARPDLAR